MSKLLEVNNLKVSYHTYAGEVQSVRGVSFALDKGESLAIVGESGCGKTVTSKTIMGLINTPPGEIKEDSEILFNGRNILKFSEKEWQHYRGKDVSMIFQDPMTSLNPTMRVGNQIAESLIIHRGMSKAEALQEAVKMLEMVNIPNAKERIKQYPHQFSGGMRQRVMIAISLACNPQLLIADEPTTALDVTIQAQIMDLLKELQKKLGTAIIMITHDLGVVAGMAQKIAVMYAGKIIEKGFVDELFENPKHPYTLALLNAVPKLELKNKEKLVSIQGTPPDLLAPPKGCGFASRCKYCMKICRIKYPEVSTISDTHEVACWLQHPLAFKVDLAEDIRREL
ncbi:ABC transporter ATP-binding protein [Clostridium swellfunianum]|uniref:ABC transporter ATP-binding protein n=1 Tax=Clostridium swellfunianum TaxID=1367462 RepID=UPI00202E138A|nr:ABC transporter ATP-binding protein [Clostridium swellfunianum]MCM0647720.1 ABC transporter ATP-binding protein [Clostridium swellfunianum]